jgi:hypothetical protein
LTAREFSESIGVKPGTLTYWAWRLGREGKAATTDRPATARGQRRAPTAFVELVSEAVGDGRFELELAGGRRLRIPVGFEAEALKRPLGVVERGQ